ncbi:hypothetical protein LCGC14_2919210, partial [marine sediment metagenome]
IKRNYIVIIIVVLVLLSVFLIPLGLNRDDNMQHRRYKALGITSSVIPDRRFLWIEINSSGSFYTVATGSTDHLWYSGDKMANNAKVDVDPGNAWGGDEDHRPLAIIAAWHDADNKIIYFADSDSATDTIYVWKLDYSSSESAPTITEMGTITNNVATVVDVDIFKLGSDIFVWWVDLNEIAVEKWVDPNWVNQDSIATTVTPIYKAVVIGTKAYNIYDDETVDDLTMLEYDNAVPSLTAKAALADTSFGGTLPSITYDGNDTLSFIGNDDGAVENRLYQYSIIGNSYVDQGPFEVGFQLDRDNRATVPNEFEKGFGFVGLIREIVYEIKPHRGGIVQLQDIGDLSDASIRSITDNFVMNTDGDIIEFTEVTSEIDEIEYDYG